MHVRPLLNMFEAKASQYGKISRSEFVAPYWAKNPHIQTIFPKFVFKAPQVSFERQRINTPDGDFLDLGVLLPNDDEQNSNQQNADEQNTNSSHPQTSNLQPPYIKQTSMRIAVLFHGLEGSENSHYIQHLAHHLSEQNIATIVMHFRGCSGEVNRTPRAYHSGETSDAQHCLAWIREKFPTAQVFAVGFSLGGNMLLKLLAENTDIDLQAAVSVSAPICLSASSQAINKGFAKRYQKHLLKSMQQNLLSKMAKIDMRAHLDIQPEDVEGLSTFWLFDEHVTSKLHGFINADDYYARCSALPMLKNIQIPSLIIHAADDPFMDSRVIPNADQLSDFTAYELSEHGGHVGFFYGAGLSSLLSAHSSAQFWLPQRIIGFIQEHS